MRLFAAVLALGIALAASAAPAETQGAEVPERWRAALEKQLSPDQRLVQILTGDIDGDGTAEWIAVGEPASETESRVTVTIFEPAKGDEPPRRIFSQWLERPGMKRAGAVVQRVSPVGEVVILVGAVPSRRGDSHFVAQIYGWNRGRIRALVPKGLEFRSQGGFSIEDLDPSTPGDEVVAWYAEVGPLEQHFDAHRYVYRIYRWDGFRFMYPDQPSKTAEKAATPEAGGRAAGAKKGDLRRQMPRVAEVP